MSLLQGLLLGLSLAGPPGPMNAFIASETLRGSFLHGFRTGLGALSSDAVFAAAAYLGALTVLEPTRAQFAVSLVGGLLMAWFSVGATRSGVRLLRTPREGEEAPPPHTLRVHATGYAKALLLGLTNPYQITWWLTAGAAFIDQFGALLLGGLFLGILVWILVFPAALRLGGRGSRWFRIGVAFLSAAVLAVFAALLLVRAAGLAQEAL